MTDFHEQTQFVYFAGAVADFAHRHKLLPRSGPVVVAVSGGADSLCLLGVLHELCGPGKRWPDVSLVVAHLDHGLRGEQGRADAEFVAALAAELGLPCHVGTRDVAALAQARKRGLEEAARRARYAFLREVAAEVGAERICVGHTRDDQVETLVMRWLRGSALTGLVGMRPLTGDIARPLLAVSRAATHAYCAARGWAPREDHSNTDRHFWRNRIRMDVIPLLRRENYNIDETLIRTAEVLAEDEGYMAAQARAAAEAATRESTPERVVFDRARLGALDIALLRRVVLAALIQVADRDTVFEARHIVLAAGMAHPGKPPYYGIQLPGHTRMMATETEVVIARRGADRVKPPPPPKFAPGVPLLVPGQVDVPGTPWRITAQLLDAADSPQPGAEPATPAGDAAAPPAATHAYLDADASGQPLEVTTWRPGDRFMPLGMTHEKKLQDYFVDAKVPREERALVPVVWGPEHIVWVAGQRIDDRARVRPETRRVLALRLTRRDDVWHTEGSLEPAPLEPVPPDE
jgi:tRNA(Ile)-lysidine synthase